MVKLGAQLGNAAFHRESEGVFVVVALPFDTCVQVTFLVDCYVVVLFYGVEQLIFVAHAFVLDAKLVNYKGEHNWPPLVAPQARGDGSLLVVVIAEVLLQESVG